MEDHLTKLQFQIEKLGYKFHNVDLLTKALTHSIEETEINPHFPIKNKTNQRLAVVGEAVLKLVISEYVILSSKSLNDDAGSWEIKKWELVQVEKQTEIGKTLFARDCANQAFLKTKPELVRVAASDRSNPCFALPYDRIVKALFGAVYLDFGGCRGNGLAKCLRLFQKLWKSFLPENEKVDGKFISDCFPEPSAEVKEYWKNKGLLNGRFIENFIKSNLNLKDLFCFDDHIILQAIIHQSFYDDIKNNVPTSIKRLPDCQRLKFLGDAVLNAVLAEYFWSELPDVDDTGLSRWIRRLAEDKFKRKIYQDLELDQFVIKKENLQNWNCHSDIVKSIIGAVYVVWGSRDASKFVFDKWELAEQTSPSSLLDLQCKLGYKFANEQILITALTHPSFYNDDLANRILLRKEVDRFLWLGKAAVTLETTVYALRTSAIDASPDSIEKFRNDLCGKKVLSRLFQYLQLRGLFQVNFKGRFRKRGNYVYILLGAVYRQLWEAGQSWKFRNIFLRLWNPHMDQVAVVRTLKECFIRCPSNAHDLLRIKLGHYLEPTSYLNYLKGHVERSMEYKFRDSTLLEQAVTGRISKTLFSNPTLGDCVKLSMIGKCALKLFPALTNNLEKQYIPMVQNSFRNAKESFNLQLLYWYYTVPEARMGEAAEPLDDQVYEAVFGAIFVDMYETGNLLDKNYSKWTRYMENFVLFEGEFQRERHLQTLHLSLHQSLLYPLEKFRDYCNTPVLRNRVLSLEVFKSEYFALTSLNVHQLRDRLSCGQAEQALIKLPLLIAALKKNEVSGKIRVEELLWKREAVRYFAESGWNIKLNSGGKLPPFFNGNVQCPGQKTPSPPTYNPHVPRLCFGGKYQFNHAILQQQQQQSGPIPWKNHVVPAPYPFHHHRQHPNWSFPPQIHVPEIRNNHNYDDFQRHMSASLMQAALCNNPVRALPFNR